MRLPLVLFLIAPFLEIASLILVGQAIGVLWTLALVVSSAVLGLFLLKQQGGGILRRLQEETQRGIDPSREMVHGALLVVAAFLLIVPGFAGDIIGLLLFIPKLRDLLWQMLKPRIIIKGQFRQAGGRGYRNGFGTETVVDLDDGEFTREPRRNSPWNGPRIGGD
ncbi:FxsA family protein [Rhizobium glycinendophyticum]|uniref:Membrane protein FxsA n=1 Tax=Rhizobium glycinendophyticum TaxID=2589807 RepID=A0A504U9G1_9HYPH|nr:FxsA family protein [Rhizobium glycinendophyticum]TPP07305.1 membrane protein FxsA [Rhizobium glycinendophyticum]